MEALVKGGWVNSLPIDMHYEGAWVVGYVPDRAYAP